MEMTTARASDASTPKLLTLLGAPSAPPCRHCQMEQAALRNHGAIGSARYWSIDEVHNILAGILSRAAHRSEHFAFLSNRLQISLSASAYNEAREAISGDVQLARKV